jgi:hypothetical protein
VAINESYLAWDVMRAVSLFCTEEMKAVFFVFDQPDRRLCKMCYTDFFPIMGIPYRTHLGEDNRPLERSAVQGLALSTMAMLCVYGVSMKFKCNISAPTLTIET